MQVIFSDNFEGANGTALAAHVPQVGGNWTSGNAGFKLQGNECSVQGNQCDSQADLNYGKTATLKCDVNPGNWTGNAGNILWANITDQDGAVYGIGFGPTGYKAYYDTGFPVPILNANFLGGFGESGPLELRIGPGAVIWSIAGQQAITMPRATEPTLLETISLSATRFAGSVMALGNLTITQ